MSTEKMPLSSWLQRIPGWLVAVLMVLLLSSWFAPGGQQIHQQQLDFWLAWLGCMLLLAWPMTLLELALARRSQNSPLAAFGPLTREADSKPVWRGIGYLAVAAMAFFAGGLTHQAAVYGHALMPQLALLPMALATLGVTLLLSLWPATLVWVGALLAVMAVGLSSFAQGIGHWSMTAFSLVEWSQAVILALVASGLGLGLYWQTALSQPQASKASQQALPIWTAQLAAGGAFAVAQGIQGTLATGLYAAALLCGAGYLLAVVRSQWSARGLSPLLSWALCGALLALWLLPLAPVWGVLASVLGLLVCLFYALFVGWQMKISHVRKALAFDQEGVYNLWRVVVRLGVPLSVLLALVGIVQAVLQQAVR